MPLDKKKKNKYEYIIEIIFDSSDTKYKITNVNGSLLVRTKHSCLFNINKIKLLYNNYCYVLYSMIIILSSLRTRFLRTNRFLKVYSNRLYVQYSELALCVCVCIIILFESCCKHVLNYTLCSYLHWLMCELPAITMSLTWKIKY